jgi:butyryl-CoA dehydrogenase
LERVSARLLGAPDSEGEALLAGASAYLSLFGRVLLGWMWLRMAGVRGSEDDAVLAQKRELAVFYARYFAPEFDLHAARALRDLESASAPASGAVSRQSTRVSL